MRFIDKLKEDILFVWITIKEELPLTKFSIYIVATMLWFTLIIGMATLSRLILQLSTLSEKFYINLLILDGTLIFILLITMYLEIQKGVKGE